MLSPTLIRSARACVRQHPTAWRATTTTRTPAVRTLAQNHKPSHGGNKPVKHGKPALKPDASAANRAQQSSAGFSKQQDEFHTPASPARNTAPTKPPPIDSPGHRAASAFEQQADFDTSSSPQHNTPPQTSSKSAVDPAEVDSTDQPLPDLTKGIPSTIEYELSRGARVGGLNLTEAETDGEAGGGRGHGELPASAYISSVERKRLRFANYLYAGVATAFVLGTIYLGRNWDDEEEEKKHSDAPSGWSPLLWWNRSRARLGDQLGHYTEPAFPKLLPDPDPMYERPYTLVLGMEDVLVHSEWSRDHGWRVAKRPGMDYFLRYLSQYYELVIWTPQPMGIADPIVRKLDPFHIITWPLYREATVYKNGECVKDISYLNRPLTKTLMIDCKPSHTSNQPENAIVLPPWKGDLKDTGLISLIPFLEYIAAMNTSDVREALASFKGHDNIAAEFARREAIARQKFQEQYKQEAARRPRRSGLGALSDSLGIKSGGMMVMTEPGEPTTGEAFAQGKMLQDIARERGLKQYEFLEKQIRENGETWLKEEQAAEEKMRQENLQGMKQGFQGWFGFGGGAAAAAAAGAGGDDAGSKTASTAAASSEGEK